MTATKSTAERIAHVQSRIDDMHRCIGSAYLDGDDESIAWYTMHLNAWRSELEGLQEQAEAESDGADPSELTYERCIELLSASRADWSDKQVRLEQREETLGADSSRCKHVRRMAKQAWDRYDAQVELVAAIFHKDFAEVNDTVRLFINL